MKLTLQKIAKIINGELKGNPFLIIKNISSFEEAKRGDITILRSEKKLPFLNQCKASAVIIPNSFPEINFNCIKVEDISLALAKLISYFVENKIFKGYISDDARISETAILGKNVMISPFVYIGENSKIGKNSVLHPFVYIGNNVEIGDECILHSMVSIYNNCKIGNRVTIHAGSVIGADGFGYAREGGKFIKIPHIGKVIIEDDVEIGANTCVDRATLGKTVIKKGTKVDNLVQIAHNCIIGEDCAIAGMVGLAGSTIIGDRVMIGGQAGTAGHLTIGNDSVIGGQAGVTRDMPPNSQATGTPAIDLIKWKRINVLLLQLPDLYKKIQYLENKIKELTNSSSK